MTSFANYRGRICALRVDDHIIMFMDIDQSVTEVAHRMYASIASTRSVERLPCDVLPEVSVNMFINIKQILGGCVYPASTYTFTDIVNMWRNAINFQFKLIAFKKKEAYTTLIAVDPGVPEHEPIKTYVMYNRLFRRIVTVQSRPSVMSLFLQVISKCMTEDFEVALCVPSDEPEITSKYEKAAQSMQSWSFDTVEEARLALMDLRGLA